MRIGELAAASGISSKTIRFYEQEGLMPEPARTTSGYRDYSDDHITRLQFIRRAQAAGLSLAEARQILTIVDSGEAPCSHVEHVLSRRLDQVRAQIAELVTLETHLEALLATARRGPSRREHDHAAVCWIIESDAQPSA
ncbi:heavy metal-responsive transcriptional regulator [Nocardia gipuzkoensis]|uniref:heavy metal-responsive transcriptional regulator n=1 Tax=Nocardia gipuzkoensis TaxID=2749991 RepID=UPI001E5A082A|nr:heavy metal-responsive transcriptional regulator [Nocardia gipuzkoensis]UGT70902.1 heavy metal-responsive transcriptional regulator [Nocardia gipuzkoensis]